MPREEHLPALVVVVANTQLLCVLMLLAPRVFCVCVCAVYTHTYELGRRRRSSSSDTPTMTTKCTHFVGCIASSSVTRFLAFHSPFVRSRVYRSSSNNVASAAAVAAEGCDLITGHSLPPSRERRRRHWKLQRRTAASTAGKGRNNTTTTALDSSREWTHTQEKCARNWPKSVKRSWGGRRMKRLTDRSWLQNSGRTPVKSRLLCQWGNVVCAQCYSTRFQV